jgi:hypothetical protein
MTLSQWRHMFIMYELTNCSFETSEIKVYARLSGKVNLFLSWRQRILHHVPRDAVARNVGQRSQWWRGIQSAETRSATGIIGFRVVDSAGNNGFTKHLDTQMYHYLNVKCPDISETVTNFFQWPDVFFVFFKELPWVLNICWRCKQ